MFRVHCWGVRGSLPVSGPEFQRYGGNTFCIEVQCGDNRLLFDAGSGLHPAARAMMSEGVKHYNLFFTHCHYDHIIGLPFLYPIYMPDNRIEVWAGHLGGTMTTRDMMDSFIQPPWFPVRLDMCRAKLEFHDFNAGDTLDIAPGLALQTAPLNHPGNSTGYRIEWGGKTFALISDTEHVPGAPLDENVLRLIKDADLFLYDCMYVDAEMDKHRGFGHSTWTHAIRLAEAAGAKKVGFVHHSPLRNDDQLDEIAREAAKVMPDAFPVADGAVFHL